jgi:oligopeptide/dipeptide ABC transporter ATP-binding protein
MTAALDPSLFEPDWARKFEVLAGRKALAFWSDVWRRYRRNIPAMASLILLFIFALLAIFAPMLTPRRWDQVDLFGTYQRPSLTHWFGTDALGRDIWLSVWFGARVSLTMRLTAALAQMLIGVLIGCFSGFRGGRVDMLIMRFVDIMIAIPFLIWVSLFMLVLQPGMSSIKEELFSNPLHPYTQALLSSVLIPDPNLEAARVEKTPEGELPRPIANIKGCAFRGRCPFAQEKCATMQPVLTAAAPQHMVMCTLYGTPTG